MNEIIQFIEDIDLIRHQLHSLEVKYSELHNKCQGDEFEEQNKYAAEVENLITLLTHEVSCQIGFGTNDLKTLLKFIDFRKAYANYKEEELIDLIDKNNEINLLRKTEIAKGKREQNATTIISEWNKAFENSSYTQLKKRLRLK